VPSQEEDEALKKVNKNSWRKESSWRKLKEKFFQTRKRKDDRQNRSDAKKSCGKRRKRENASPLLWRRRDSCNEPVT